MYNEHWTVALSIDVLCLLLYMSVFLTQYTPSNQSQNVEMRKMLWCGFENLRKLLLVLFLFLLSPPVNGCKEKSAKMHMSKAAFWRNYAFLLFDKNPRFLKTDYETNSVADPNPDPDPPYPHVLGLPDPDPLVKAMNTDPGMLASWRSMTKIAGSGTTIH